MSVQIQEIKPKQKGKKFERSRSKSNSNPANSPKKRACNSRFSFFPTFIPQKHINKKQSARLCASFSEQQAQESIEDELCIIHLEEQLRLKVNQQARLIQQNNDLRAQLADYEERLGINTPKREVLKQFKGNRNLARLKMQIVQSRCLQMVPTFQALQQQNRLLKAENALYKNSLSQLQKSYKELCKKVQSTQRQNQLQDTVLKLQEQLKNQQEQNRKLDMRLKISLAKTANQQRNTRDAKQQELQTLKTRYSKMVKKCHNLSQELNSTKLKMEDHSNLPYSDRVISLSLSPEDR